MKLRVFGAGAIGGYLAVELASAGHRIRPANATLQQFRPGIPEEDRKIRGRRARRDLVETSGDKAPVVCRVIDDVQNHFATRHCALPTPDKNEANNFL